MMLFIFCAFIVLAIGTKAADKLALILVCGAIGLIPVFGLFLLALCYPPLAWGLGAAAAVGIFVWIVRLLFSDSSGSWVSYDVNGDKI